MLAYRRLKAGVISFLVCILVIGYAAIPLPNNELFPFYSWSMFSKVPGKERVFAVYITGVGPRKIEPPVEFQNAGSLVGQPDSVVAFRAIQEMGQAWEKGDKGAVRTLRQVFEQNYLYVGTKYSLARTEYDPLTRWKTGARSITVLEEWERMK